MISEEVNKFFNDCAVQVKANRQKLKSQFGLTDEDIKNIKNIQPNINIADVTRAMIQSADPTIKSHIKGTKIINKNKYNQKFDDSLTSLWFCFYRFLFIKKLDTININMQISIVIDVFFKFVKYITIDTIKDGQQITAFLNTILYSVAIVHIRQYSKQQEYVDYATLMQQLDKTIYFDNDLSLANEDGPFHQYMSVKYISDYLIEQIPDIDFIEDLNRVIKKGQPQLSDKAQEIFKKYCNDNNITGKELISKAISSHKEYTIASLFEDK